MKNIYYYNSKIGSIGIIEEDNNIVKITFDIVTKDDTIKFKETDNIKKCYEQIELYLDGKVKKINIDTNIKTTEFSKKVFDEVCKIKYGETLTYTDIAKKIGNEKSYRSVSRIINKNPLPIIIPCHRVVSKDGKSNRYVGDIEIKDKLLKLEKEYNDKK